MLRAHAMVSWATVWAHGAAMGAWAGTLLACGRSERGHARAHATVSWVTVWELRAHWRGAGTLWACRMVEPR